MLIDSHCHLDLLDLDQYNATLDEIIKTARDSGVDKILCPGVSLKKFPEVLSIVNSYEDVYGAVALHPSEIDQIDSQALVEKLITHARNEKIVAIGETGLDYFHMQNSLEMQKERFRAHIRAAKDVKKPIIVHTRQAKDDTISILKEEGACEVGVVMHCFTEDISFAKKLFDLGFYISFSGIVTFPKALELHEVAKHIPLDRILIETDSPYLAPVPKRGKPNQPTYLRYIAEYLAELRGVSFDEFAEKTSRNFCRLFL